MTQKPLLLCLPYAGAGASVFEPWREAVGDRVDLCALDLPGHEQRFSEPLCHHVIDAVEAMAPRAYANAKDRNNVVMFGHSLGAVLAFELARKLTTDYERVIKHLVVSGSPGPWHKRGMRASGLDDDSFLEQVASIAGYDHPALHDLDLRDVLLPIIRADVEMHERYEALDRQPISLGITIMRGCDDALVSKEDALQWRDATSADLRYVECPGPHMYFADNRGSLIARLIELCLGAGQE
jgi:surfactin synthase thioesterase subunit